MEVTEALDGCGGAARWSRLRGLGVTNRALRTGLAVGAVRAAGRGGYALPGATPGLVAAVQLGGVASHGTAAGLHGLAIWREPAYLHVTVPLGTRRSSPGVTLHRADLGVADRDPRLAATSLRRTLLDCGRTMPLLDAVVVLDSALRGGAVTAVALRAAAESARGHGAAALRCAVRHVDALAGSPLESALRLLLDLLGADVRSQVWIPGVGRVDFLVDGWLVIEADGFAFHSDRVAYRTDRRRANALAGAGTSCSGSPGRTSGPARRGSWRRSNASEPGARMLEINVATSEAPPGPNRAPGVPDVDLQLTD